MVKKGCNSEPLNKNFFSDLIFRKWFIFGPESPATPIAVNPICKTKIPFANDRSYCPIMVTGVAKILNDIIENI